MATIYLKSPDEKTVVSIRGKNPEPDEYLMDKGYQQIEQAEFRRLKRRIMRSIDLTTIKQEVVDEGCEEENPYLLHGEELDRAIASLYRR